MLVFYKQNPSGIHRASCVGQMWKLVGVVDKNVKANKQNKRVPTSTSRCVFISKAINVSNPSN